MVLSALNQATVRVASSPWRNVGLICLHRCRASRHALRCLSSTAAEDGGTSTQSGCAVTFNKHGHPPDVVTVTPLGLPRKPGPGEVQASLVAAPINPADINVIQGTYAVLPDKLPFVGGNEGLFVVTDAGAGVSLRPGQHVIPDRPLMGTWQSRAYFQADQLLPIPRSVPALAAATLAVNPCTAYRMLQDFVALKAGDVVIMNGGTSAVSQAALQLCKHRDIQAIAVIRDRDDFAATENYLKGLGAVAVLKEEELGSRHTKQIVSEIGRAKLALNCVGGKQTTNMLRHVADNAVVVTYGAMSRQPLPVPAGMLIFKNIQFRGFWMTKWNELAAPQDREDMLQELCRLMESGALTVNTTTHDISDAKAAIEASMAGKQITKHVLVDEQVLHAQYSE